MQNIRVDPEDCKTAEGVWKKYIRERLSEEELVALEEFNTLCNQSIILDYLSENHRIRFLHGSNFNIQVTYNLLIESETMRYQLGCDEVTG